MCTTRPEGHCVYINREPLVAILKRPKHSETFVETGGASRRSERPFLSVADGRAACVSLLFTQVDV